MAYVLLQPVLDVGVICEHLPGLRNPMPNPWSSCVLLSRIPASQSTLPPHSCYKSSEIQLPKEFYLSVPYLGSVSISLSILNPGRAVQPSGEGRKVETIAEAGPWALSSNPVSAELHCDPGQLQTLPKAPAVKNMGVVRSYGIPHYARGRGGTRAERFRGEIPLLHFHTLMRKPIKTLGFPFV